MSKVQWLCQCGHGSLSIEEEDIPDYCPVCEYPWWREKEADFFPQDDYDPVLY
tara:strand:+ start:1296 stop:1454 length:159 start_codon:yes stop_codon:yes gene_type:complete